MPPDVMSVHPLVRRVAASFVLPAWLEREDLVQVGMLAVVELAPRFQPSGAKWSTVAATKARYAMIDYLRGQGRFGPRRGPTYWPDSLDRLVPDDEGEVAAIVDMLPARADPVDDAVVGAVHVRCALAALPVREGTAVCLRMMGVSTRDVGRILGGVSASRATQLTTRGLARLRDSGQFRAEAMPTRSP